MRYIKREYSYRKKIFFSIYPVEGTLYISVTRGLIHHEKFIRKNTLFLEYLVTNETGILV